MIPSISRLCFILFAATLAFAGLLSTAHAQSSASCTISLASQTAYEMTPDAPICQPFTSIFDDDAELLIFPSEGSVGLYTEAYLTRDGSFQTLQATCTGRDCGTVQSSYSAGSPAFVTCEGVCSISFSQSGVPGGPSMSGTADAFAGTLSLTATFPGEAPQDTTPPQVTLSYMGIFGETMTFPINANEPITRTTAPSISANAEILSATSSSVTARLISPGPVTVSFPAGAFVDAAGNPSAPVSASSPDMTIALDLVSPTGIITGRALDEVSITASLDRPVDAGTLSLAVDGVTFAVEPVQGGKATFDHAFQAGAHIVSFRYDGTGTGYVASEPEWTTSAEIAKRASGLTLDASPATTTVDETVLVTGTLDPEETGTVRLLAGGQELDSEQVGAGQSFQLHFTPTSAGPEEIHVSTSGDTNFDSHEGQAWTLQVDPIEKSVAGISLSISSGDKQIGSPITMTASLDTVAPGGELRLEVDGELIAIAPSDSGRIEADFTPKTAGTYTLRASFSGTQSVTATEEEASVSIAQVRTALSLSAEKTRLTPGGIAVLRIATPATPEGGTVTLRDDIGSRVLWTAEADGRASYDITLPDLNAGEMSLVATYTGSASHAPSHSESLRIKIQTVAITLGLTAHEAEVKVGEDARLTASISPDPATGAIVIYENGDPISEKQLTGAGSYQFEITQGAVGTRSYTVHFAGSERHDPAQSSAVSVAARAIETTLDLSTDNSEPATGEPIRLTARITPADATGTVRFFAGTMAIGDAALSKGVARVDWTAARGRHALTASYLGDLRHSPAEANPLILEVMPSTQEIFEERKADVARVVSTETQRASRARLRLGDWMMREARGRLRRGQGEAEVSRGWTPLSYTGRIDGTDGQGDWTGRFHGGGSLGDYRRYVYGDFNLAWEEDFGTTVEFNGAVAFEKSFSNDTLAGVTFGAEIGKSRISLTFEGDLATWGLNAGAYGAKRIANTVVIDGFANLARLFHDMDMSDEELAVEGRYASTALQFGGAITGEKGFEAFTLEPELAVMHSVQWSDDAAMTARTETGEADVWMDSEKSSTSRISLTPRFLKSIDFGIDSTASLSPRVACEISKGGADRSDCGAGLGLGIDAGIAQGLGRFTGDVELEEIGGSRRALLSLEFTLDF